MGDFDLSCSSDLKTLCDKIGRPSDNYSQLINNHLTPKEFHNLSKNISLKLSDDVDVIYSNLQKAFDDGKIVIIDNNYMHRKVKIKNIKLFVENLLSGVCSIVEKDVISSLQKIFEFVLKNCLVSNKTRSEQDDDVYKIRFPYRIHDLIYIFIFKIKIDNLLVNKRISFFGKRTYIAEIVCLNTVFYVSEDQLKN